MASLPKLQSHSLVNDSINSKSTKVGCKQSFEEFKEETMHPPQREIEIKLLGKSILVDVMLIFENFLVWLVGLEPSRVGKIQLSGFENKESFVASLDPNKQLGDVVDRIIHRFSPTRVSFTESHTSRPSPNCLVLISGSLQYIASVVDWCSMSGNVIGVVDHHFHGRLRNGRPRGISVSSMLGGAVWTRVRHESVGGVTKFVGLFCSLMNLDPLVSTLQQTLNHIVDFSLRQRCIRDSDDRFTSALTLQQRLYPGNLEQFIVYPTHLCCTGFGYRSLMPNELAHAFGLPMSICVGGCVLRFLCICCPCSFFTPSLIRGLLALPVSHRLCLLLQCKIVCICTGFHVLLGPGLVRWDVGCHIHGLIQPK
jgi:hypothetical protein